MSIKRIYFHMDIDPEMGGWWVNWIERDFKIGDPNATKKSIEAVMPLVEQSTKEQYEAEDENYDPVTLHKDDVLEWLDGMLVEIGEHEYGKYMKTVCDIEFARDDNPYTAADFGIMVKD